MGYTGYREGACMAAAWRKIRDRSVFMRTAGFGAKRPMNSHKRQKQPLNGATALGGSLRRIMEINNADRTQHCHHRCRADAVGQDVDLLKGTAVSMFLPVFASRSWSPPLLKNRFPRITWKPSAQFGINRRLPSQQVNGFTR